MMRRNVLGNAVLFATTLTLVSSGMVFGKGQDGPPPQGFPGRGPRHDGQGRPPMPPREMTLATAPMRELSTALKLTDEQRGKFQKILEDLHPQHDGTRPEPPEPGQEPSGNRFEKRKEVEEKAKKELEAVLTEDQKKQVPVLLRSWNIMRGLGLSLDTADKLKLSEEQIAILEKAVKTRPRPPQGGRQDFRGPGGGPGRGQGGQGGGPDRFGGQGRQGGPGGRDGRGGPGGPGGFEGPGGPGGFPPPGGDGDGPPPQE